MIQDWGYNHLYLRQENAVTRINLKDHSYRDVMKTPVEEFDSTTTRGSDLHLWSSGDTHLWICGASECGSLRREDCQLDRDKEDKEYIPDPFPEELFKPLKWMQMLATMDICTNETTPTKFVDEEGMIVRHFG